MWETHSFNFTDNTPLKRSFTVSLLFLFQVTIYILKTIRLGLDGIESLQFTSPGKLLSFKKPAEMNNILLVENTLSDDGNGLELVGTDHSRVSVLFEEKY